MSEISQETDEINELCEQLKKEHNIEDMVSFNELNVLEKLQNNVLNTIRYKELYFKELDVINILERKMDALKGIRYKYYKFEDNHEWKPKEIEEYCLPADEKIIKLKKIIDKQKVKVRFFEMCWKALDKQNWAMKTWSDRDRFGV